MEYIKHEEISYCTVFNLKLSQDEIEVYESCMKYVLQSCSKEQVYNLIGCRVEELQAWQTTLRELLVTYVDEELLPTKYKDKDLS